MIQFIQHSKKNKINLVLVLPKVNHNLNSSAVMYQTEKVSDVGLNPSRNVGSHKNRGITT